MNVCLLSVEDSSNWELEMSGLQESKEYTVDCIHTCLAVSLAHSEEIIIRESEASERMKKGTREFGAKFMILLR